MVKRCLRPLIKAQNKMFLALFFSWLLWAPQPLQAQSLSLQDLYINPVSQKLPEAIILYSTDTPCENCDTAINMLVDTLKQNYKDKLHAYLINLTRHPEYIHAFKINAPLTLVIVRISDGAAFGFEKLEGLQSEIGDKTAFNNRVCEFINNFLGWN